MAGICLDFLRQTFPQKLISRFGDNPWQSQSPDLTSADFFLWGYLKQQAFQTRPATILDLKNRNREAITAILGDILRKVMDSFQHRLEECLVHGGHDLPGVIFKQ